MTPAASPCTHRRQGPLPPAGPAVQGPAAPELHDIAASLRERAVPAGEAILVEGGPPGEELYVVRLGALRADPQGCLRRRGDGR